MVDQSEIELFYKSVYVIGNNYDGCLLTGDTNDLIEFEESKVLKNSEFRRKLLNHSEMELGLKNAALIDSKQKIIFIRI